MKQIFLNTSARFLYIGLTNDNDYDEILIDAAQKQTDLALLELKKILFRNNLQLKDIERIVFTNGPGSYTGIRVSLTFLKVLWTLNPNLIVYQINSLLVQIGMAAGWSILPAYRDKVFIAFYAQGTALIPPQLVDNATALTMIATNAKLPDLVVREGNLINFRQNFEALFPKWTLLANSTELTPFHLHDLYQ